MTLQTYRRLALLSILGLVVVYLIFGITRAPEHRTLVLLLTALPLTLPIRGTIAGRGYTIAYSSLLSTGYFCVSGWLYIVYLDWVRWLMLCAVVLSLLWFFACVVHNKKLKIQRKKNHPAN